MIYPVNFVGHDEWMKSGYSLGLASGDVITREGEFLGGWRVVDYDPDDEDAGGTYEFVLYGQEVVKFSERFEYLDFRISRGFALQSITRTINEWHQTPPQQELLA